MVEMKDTYPLVIIIAVAIAFATLWPNNNQTCTVSRVIDADTIECREVQEPIRLASIYAAEVDTSEGREAKQKLQSVLPLGTKVTLIPSEDGRTHDKYNRRLADIYISDQAKNELLQKTLKEVNTHD